MYEKFEELLADRNVTAYRVAKDLDMPRSAFSGWKNGRSTPKIETLQRIADYFNVPVSYFYENEQSKEEKDAYVEMLANRIVNEIFGNESMKTLFDLAQDASEDDVKILIEVLKRFKK